MPLSPLALVDLIQAKTYLRLSAASSETVFAEFIALGDGTTKIFNLVNIPISGSLRLYIDGTLQVETINYTIVGKTITFIIAPALNKPITANYEKSASANTFQAWDDELLEKLIEAATKKAEDFSGNIFIQGLITENRVGNGDNRLRLNWQPVKSITSVKLDSITLTKDSEYVELLAQGILKHATGWTKDELIEVVYTAGYGTTRETTQALVPDAVEAVLLILADMYENRSDKADSINIAGIGSTSYNLPSRAEKILSGLTPTGGFF
ncbi:MAG: hypothetical protein Q8M94_19775 [Ignavibacteria bacterium]|nr:hypothetical protein [Ignavibacteria bacterium]